MQKRNILSVNIHCSLNNTRFPLTIFIVHFNRIDINNNNTRGSEVTSFLILIMCFIQAFDIIENKLNCT